MGIQFNPLSGTGLDLVGTGGGGGSPPVPNYFDTFDATTDWGAASGGLYTITITVATHGKGLNPVVSVLEQSGADYININVAFKIDASGNIIIEVLETPDNRFAGKIIVSENN